MDRKKIYETILTICTGLLVLGFIMKTYGLFRIAAAVGVLSLLSPWIARFVSWLWYKLSEILGAISSRIILFIIYFIILVPLALLSRIFGRSILQMKKKDHDRSCFVELNHRYTAADMEDMW